MENSATRIFEDALTFALEKLGEKDIRLREQQYEAIKNITVDNQDTVCVLPTGYGKSLIYQLLPDVFDYYLSKTSRKSCKTDNFCSSTIIVISPLNALMLDQVNKLQKYVKVCILKEGVEENISPKNMVEKIRQPSQIIFTHPEVLIENKSVFHTLSSTSFKYRMKAIVIDEAHLIKEW